MIGQLASVANYTVPKGSGVRRVSGKHAEASSCAVVDVLADWGRADGSPCARSDSEHRRLGIGGRRCCVGRSHRRCRRRAAERQSAPERQWSLALLLSPVPQLPVSSSARPPLSSVQPAVPSPDHRGRLLHRRCRLPPLASRHKCPRTSRTADAAGAAWYRSSQACIEPLKQAEANWSRAPSVPRPVGSWVGAGAGTGATGGVVVGGAASWADATAGTRPIPTTMSAAKRLNMSPPFPPATSAR